jgi:1-acyl-sn-glycerol-3-phosphate acyltransferase
MAVLAETAGIGYNQIVREFPLRTNHLLSYYIAWIIARILFCFCIRCEVKGKDNVPHRGSVIVVANHLTNIDPPLLGFCLGRRAAYLAKEELFTIPVLAFVFKQLGAFPVRRGRLNKDALKKSYEVLGKGMALVIFPEGMRSPQGRLQAAYDGTALIALRSKAPILPVGIAGTEAIKGLRLIWRRPKVVVSIGVPFCLPEDEGKIEREQLTECTEQMMSRIAGLLPPEYRGIYSGRSRGVYSEHSRGISDGEEKHETGD